ncbi:LysR family transcriptional regulator [Pseudomonas guariconensis]|uniref:LysR family transcriptional regulator n=1 Tax=Pseudomonas guariconensis TaxID=1288410 RepID=UPI002DD6E4C0|nr:LysR family transcriptional regulator [Pseudomonas aeruginosa]
MNFRQIKQFLAVAETQSFRKAAEKLHIAQPPLSTGIRRLETDLGVQLFERGRRGARLTEAGQAILVDAQKIVFHAEQLRSTVAAMGQGVGGSLSIGFVGSATYLLLPRVLPLFRSLYPKVVLELREGTTTQILRDLQAGTLDLGLVRYPVAVTTPVKITPVEWDRLVVALPAGHPLSRRKRLALADLSQESFILYSATNAANLRAQVLLACQAAGFAPRVTQEAVQVQTMVSLVESGIGVALVPAASSTESTRRVAFRELSADASLDVALGAAVLPSAESNAARRFREILEQNVLGAPEKPAGRRLAGSGRRRV